MPGSFDQSVYSVIQFLGGKKYLSDVWQANTAHKFIHSCAMDMQVVSERSTMIEKMNHSQ